MWPRQSILGAPSCLSLAWHELYTECRAQDHQCWLWWRFPPWLAPGSLALRGPLSPRCKLPKEPRRVDWWTSALLLVWSRPPSGKLKPQGLRVEQQGLGRSNSGQIRAHHAYFGCVIQEDSRTSGKEGRSGRTVPPPPHPTPTPSPFPYQPPRPHTLTVMISSNEIYRSVFWSRYRNSHQLFLIAICVLSTACLPVSWSLPVKCLFCLNRPLGHAFRVALVSFLYT